MSASRNGIVIVGGGQAGLQVAASLRHEGYDGPVRLIAEEPHLPYQRPPLSKAYLMGKAKADTLPLRPQAFYDQNEVELMLGTRAEAIDPAARRVRAGGRDIAYDGLALVTGGRVRKLPLPGADADGVVYLRTLEDSDAIKARLAGVAHVVVIGGGFIGLEVAASARSLGKEVTVLEALPRLMARAVSPALSDFFAGLHGGHGVTVALGCAVEAIETEKGRVVAVRLADGTRHAADLIVVGIGIEPCAEIAGEAGLACQNGIVVDAAARTEAPGIVAAGDCTSHPNPFADGAQIRLESVQNAFDQAKTAALALLGKPEPYHAVPWFWSDQYDIKLQMVGLATGCDAQVTRGDPAQAKFSVFSFKQGKLAAIDSVNRPADHMLGRRLIGSGAALSPEQAADESFDLKGLLRPRA